MTASTIKTQQRPWGLTLVLGILAVVLGGVLLWAPVKTSANVYLVLVQLLGIWWLVSGVMDIAHMFQDHSMWGWKLFIGVVSMIAGGVVLMYPVAAAVQLPKIFVLVMGIWGVMYGIILLIMAFRGGGWGAGILGALGIIFGIILMLNWYKLGWGLSMLWVGAITALVGGVALIFQAFRQRKA